MSWFRATCTIEMEIEARDEESARSKAETILNKRVVGQSFGHYKNDRGEVVDWRDVKIEPNEEDDYCPPGPNDCPDCGAVWEKRGHYGCLSPVDDPNIEGLEDPMERER